MKDSKRDELLRGLAENVAILVGGTEAAKPLRELTPKGTSFATVAINKLEEYVAGYPAGGGDGRGGGEQDARIFAALKAVGTTPSAFDERLAAASTLIAQVVEQATRAAVVIPAHKEKTTDNPDDWCASCARLKDHKNRPYAVPSALVPKAPEKVRRTPEGQEHAGTALCAWCYGWALGEGEWPPLALIEKRRDGVRITSKVLADVGVSPKSDTQQIAS